MSAEKVAKFAPSMAHLDRTLGLLQRYYPQRTAAECREALARMYGHAGWEELGRAAKQGANEGAFDEDCSFEVVNTRFLHHYDMVLLHLAGMTDERMLAAQELDQEVLSTAVDSISKRYHPAFNEKRVERARCAWTLLYARHAVLEIRPTARTPAAIPADRDDIEMSFRVDLLPRALKAWLSHHRPLLVPAGERIGALQVRQCAAADLLNFSFQWGEICLHQGVDIPKPLQVYPVALCAKWFAWITCSGAPHLKPLLAMLNGSNGSVEQRRQAAKKFNDAIHEEEARFILAQPREDFRTHSASAREQQINAGYALVRRYMSGAASESAVREIMTRTVWTALAPAMRGS